MLPTFMFLAISSTICLSTGLPLVTENSTPATTNYSIQPVQGFGPVSTSLVVQHTYDNVVALAEMRRDMESKFQIILDRITGVDDKITDVIKDKVEPLVEGDAELKTAIDRVRNESNTEVNRLKEEINIKFKQASRDRSQIKNAVGMKEMCGIKV